ncbi:MAG: sensor histidine kinase [Pseudomonadales bacterium]|nr:sensor histidine kinase [Pseudomonadales bacterium]
MSTTSLATIQRSQFWIFQLVGWAVWVVILILLNLIFVPPALEFIFPLALVYCMNAAVAVLLTAGLRILYRFVWEKGFVVRFLVAWFGSFFAAMLWQPFQNYVALLPFGETMDLSAASLEDIFDNLLVNSYPLMLLWSGFYFIIKYYQLFQIEKEKSLRSEALAHEAQLLMLRYQLNPHFLFNTLNAISTLVLSKATEQANEMVTKLSKFLRYSLDHSPLDRVSLAHELETSRLYLDIEKVRFADRLKLEFDIEPDAESALVPTMLLQPIIENSIKHGITKNEAGGTITIKARKKGRLLTLEVTDDGPGLSEEDADEKLSLSKGVGISNIRNRLQEIYGGDHELMFTNVEPSGLKVMVVIPYDAK